MAGIPPLTPRPPRPQLTDQEIDDASVRQMLLMLGIGLLIFLLLSIGIGALIMILASVRRLITIAHLRVRGYRPPD